MPRRFIRRAGERRPQRDQRTRVRKPVWQDPFPGIQGSKPEKMVMAGLVARGIYFEHTAQTNTIGFGIPPGWEADFWLPQFRIWLEVNGVYFHTLGTALADDAARYAQLASVGVNVVVWWDFDVEVRLTELFASVPEFNTVQPAVAGGRVTPGLTFWEGGVSESGVVIDHLKGLRTANRNRTKPKTLVRKWRTARRPM